MRFCKDLVTQVRSCRESKFNTEYNTVVTMHVSHIKCLKAVVYTENFHGGGFIQWHMVVICIGVRCL